jgi:hypothetical protein
MAEAKGQLGTAFVYALLATKGATRSVTEYSKDVLFVDSTAYGHQAFDRLGTIAYYVGFYEAGREACETCLNLYDSDLSESDRSRISSNLSYYTSRR